MPGSIFTLFGVEQARLKIGQNMRERRLANNLSQRGLAARSGVSLGSLRRFETTGHIALDSLIRIAKELGAMSDIISATEPLIPQFQTIEDVLNNNPANPRQRGFIHD